MLQRFASILVCAVAAAGSLYAQTPTSSPQGDAARRDAARERLNAMTPEQKAEARARAKARWDAMSPEEQQAAKQRMAERRAARTSNTRQSSVHAPAP